MAQFYLINVVQPGGGVKLLPGSLIDDAITNTAPIIAAGGVLIATTNTLVAAAAVQAQAAHKKGANETDLAAIMAAAVVDTDGGAKNVSGASPISVDWLKSPGVAYCTIGVNTNFTFANANDGLSVVIAVTTTGAFTSTWPAGVKWPGGVVPTQTATGTDLYTFINIGGTIYGTATQAMA